MMNENEIGREVIDAAIAVHRELGPGIFESVYEAALAYELESRGLFVQRQVPITFKYRDLKFDQGFRATLLLKGR